ncbi:MAG TPA: cellulase family glycosylhydrolase [Candidatus Binataceae bacterium]|nr:cellulase family glycosylhydrolase [Candidatus Binataceae bacterium]
MNKYLLAASQFVFIPILAMIVVTGTVDGASVGQDGQQRTVVNAPLSVVLQPGGIGIITDGRGREVLLRGLDVNSLGEFWQFDPSLPPVLKLRPADMDFIASMGLNLVRLVISWSSVEPSPGVYDEKYLSRVAQTIEALNQRGIYTLVDLHQDAWNATLGARPNEACTSDELPAQGWDGAPAWATLTDDSTLRCIPPLAGLYERELSPAVLEAWAKFWDNRPGPGGVGIQDRYIAMLHHLATRLGGVPGVMGYDIMNEPNAYPAYLVDIVAALFPNLLAPEYVTIMENSLNSLATFYAASVTAIRAGERQAGIKPRIVLFEPSALWPNIPSGATVAPFSTDPQLAYGPHIYQGGISFLVQLDETQIQRVRDEAASFGGVPVLTGEWGASPSSAGDVGGYFEEMIADQDSEQWSTALWLYQPSCGDPSSYRQDLATIDLWGFHDTACVGPDANVPGAVRDPIFNRVSRPALHFAPSRIDSIAWDPVGNIFTASGSQAPKGSQMNLFVPRNHAGLKVSTAGLTGLTTRGSHGGRRITARANGGDWSVRVAP